MPRDSNGIMTLPTSTWVQTGDTVLPVQHNPPFRDIENALTNSIDRDGRTVMTGNLQMGGNKVTGLGDPSHPGDAMTRRVSGIEFETRADAEAWPGVDPMPESIVIRGDASVEDGSGGMFALDHQGEPTITVNGRAYGRVADVGFSRFTSDTFNRLTAPVHGDAFRRRILKDFPQLMPGFEEIKNLYEYTYLYPQGLSFDPVASWLVITWQGSGGVNAWMWHSLIKWRPGSDDHLTLIKNVSAGSQVSQGAHIWYGADGLRRISVKTGGGNLGTYFLPDNAPDGSRLTVETNLNMNLNYTMSGYGNILITQDLNPEPTQFWRYTMRKARDGLIIGRIDMRAEEVQGQGPFFNLYSKQQAIGLGPGFIAGGYGGLFQGGTAENPYHYSGVKTFTMAGEKTAEAMMYPQKVIDKLNELGFSSSRMENEGCCVLPDGTILTLFCTQAANNPDGGVLIIEEFSRHPDSIDFSDCAAPLPYLQNWRVSATMGGNQTVPGGGGSTKVSFNVGGVDRGGNFDAENSQVQPIGGAFRMEAMVAVTGGLVHLETATLSIYKNGSAVRRHLQTIVGTNPQTIGPLSLETLATGSDVYDVRISFSDEGDHVVSGSSSASTLSAHSIGGA